METELKRTLARYPEGDANSDGTLTEEEAADYILSTRQRGRLNRGPGVCDQSLIDGTHLAGPRPEQDLQSVAVTTAFRRWFSLTLPCPPTWPHDAETGAKNRRAARRNYGLSYSLSRLFPRAVGGATLLV